MTTIEEDCQLLLLDEITTEILLRLPAESVMRCKRVCKTWRALIADPVFMDLYHHQKTPEAPIINVDEWVTLCYGDDYHLHFGEYNDDGPEINPFKHSQPIICCPITTTTAANYFRLPRKRNTVCSCNGLIFLMSALANNMFVCNPFTREYVHLPLPLSSFVKVPFNIFSHRISLASGFGYNSYTNKYKIVVIYYTKHYCKCTAGYVTIYTLGSGRWRDKGEISPKLINGTEPGVFLNGALHWLTERKEIVSFDLTDEEFRIVPSPIISSQSAADIDNYVPQLGLLGGCLYLTRKRESVGDPESSSTVLDIWVMDNELQSWTRRFCIAWKLGGNLSAANYRPLALSKSDKLILFHKFGKKPLVSYDPETKSSIVDDRFSEFSESERRCVQIHYIKSFVSLKALGEMNAVEYQIYDGDQKPMICERLLHNTQVVKKRKIGALLTHLDP